MYCYIPLFVMGDLCDGGPESDTYRPIPCIAIMLPSIKFSYRAYFCVRQRYTELKLTVPPPWRSLRHFASAAVLAC